mmetsp:Transcript_9811/g.28833  ORF Transcript_9811/g.28833 Transcript_9811/m.28833 type:complete len:210 (+) Transcript_9811:72-701(+)
MLKPTPRPRHPTPWQGALGISLRLLHGLHYQKSKRHRRNEPDGDGGILSALGHEVFKAPKAQVELVRQEQRLAGGADKGVEHIRRQTAQQGTEGHRAGPELRRRADVVVAHGEGHEGRLPQQHEQAHLLEEPPRRSAAQAQRVCHTAPLLQRLAKLLQRPEQRNVAAKPAGQYCSKRLRAAHQRQRRQEPQERPSQDRAWLRGAERQHV